MLVRYDRITPELLEQIDPSVIFISGNGSAPERYTEPELEPLRRLVTERSRPTFGFCGGFQVISSILGVPLVPLGDLVADADAGNSSPFSRASVTEIGYAPVELVADHPLLDGLGDAPAFRHAHMFQVSALPEGFDLLASTELTRLQMVVDDEHRVVGTQFHPESWTDEFPAGRRLIANFLDWARS